MSVRVDEHGRAHVEPKIVPGRYVAIGLLAFITLVVVIASWIHVTNLRAREQARRAAEAAEAAERAPAP